MTVEDDFSNMLPGVRDLFAFDFAAACAARGGVTIAGQATWSVSPASGVLALEPATRNSGGTVATMFVSAAGPGLAVLLCAVTTTGGHQLEYERWVVVDAHGVGAP